MSQIQANIHIPHAQIADFCQRNQIRHISFFGSVLRRDFGPDSDIDVLVEFNPDARVGLIALAGMEIELGELRGNTVEMHTVKGLNPLFRDEVLQMAEERFEEA